MRNILLLTIGLLGAAFICQAQITLTEYPIHTANSSPHGIAAGPDDNVWFTQRLANQI